MVSKNKTFIANRRQKGSSLLRLLFVISSLASASAVCPQGYFELNGICTQQTTSCPQQYVLMNGACHFATAGSCPSTSLQINGQCCSQSCINTCQTQNNCNCCVSNSVLPAPITPSLPSVPSAPCPNTTPCQTTPCPSQPVCPNQPFTPCPTQPVTPCSTQPCPTQPVTPCSTQPPTPCPQTNTPCPVQPAAPCPAPPPAPCPTQPPTPCPQTNPPCPVQPATPCPTQPTTPCPNLPPSTPCPVQPQPCPIPPVIYPPPTYPPPIYTPPPTYPPPTYPPPTYPPPVATPPPETTTTTQKPYYPPPDPITKCPDGTVLVNGICRLVYCGKGIFKDNRCIYTECPEGTIWTGYKCAPPEPIVNTVLFQNTVITHFNRSQPDVVVNNVNNVVVNATTAIDMNMHNEAQPIPSVPPEEDCDEIPTTTPTAPRPAPTCCTVITPRMCRPSPQEGRWSCYSKRARRCGSFCVAPTIYLKAPRIYQDQTRMVLPPDPDFSYCRRTHSCPESFNSYDCSGCGTGQLDRCSSYCYNYNCNLRKCQFYDQREYCSEYGGGYGCQQQDGCYDDWCSG